MKRGMNALRCSFTSGFYNIWLLAASGLYACKEFGCEADLWDLMNQAYPYVSPAPRTW